MVGMAATPPGGDCRTAAGRKELLGLLIAFGAIPRMVVGPVLW